MEHGQHPHDVRVLEAGQGLGLGHEAIEPPFEKLAVGVGGRLHRKILLADGQLHGQVFLDGDLLVEVEVVGEIGDTEATLAQDLLDAVPVQPVARLEQIAVDRFRHVVSPVAAAPAARRWILPEAGRRLKLLAKTMPQRSEVPPPLRNAAPGHSHPLPSYVPKQRADGPRRAR